MTDAQMLALAFLAGGGAIVAVGIGALVTYLHARFDRFAELHREAAEGRAYLAARIEVAIAAAARATDRTGVVLYRLDRCVRLDSDAADFARLRRSQATILRFRAARNRQHLGRSPRESAGKRVPRATRTPR